jgi:hypothetical protein
MNISTDVTIGFSPIVTGTVKLTPPPTCHKAGQNMQKCCYINQLQHTYHDLALITFKSSKHNHLSLAVKKARL